MNHTLETIFNRRSCKAFTGEIIEREKLDLILKAAAHAPSGMNRQSWQFTVIEDKALISELCGIIEKKLCRENYNMFNPGAIVLCSNERENPLGHFDCALAAQNIFLAAYSLGVGSCWLNQLKGICGDGAVRDFLTKVRVPLSHEVYLIASLGYPALERDAPKRNYGSIVYVNR